MSEYYRIDVRYPAVQISSLTQEFPGDFSSGEHGGIWLDVTQRRWLATQNDRKSSDLAVRQFGAATGTLSAIDGGNVEMWVGKRRVGVFNLETAKRTSLTGVIATKTKTQGGIIPGTGIEVFTEGVYFSRARVWADNSAEEKFSELLRRAKKHASGEVGNLITGLLKAVPMVLAVIILLAGLGSLAGPAIAGVVALIALWGGYLVPRSMEYADKLKIVNEVMNASQPSESELEQGAAAVAEFLRLVLEDCAFAIAMKAGETAVNKVKAGKIPKEAVETLDEAFTRHRKEEFDRAAKKAEKQKSSPRPEGAAYSRAQLDAAQHHAFQDMPCFRNQKYSALKQWLLRRGFTWQKKEIIDPSGRNSNAGGSEILVRRSPELEKFGLCEVVRIDRMGHDVKFKDGPVREKVDPKTGKVTKEQEGWGGLRHFHKDVVPISMLRTYCERFVPDIISKNDFNNLVDPKSKSKFQQIHIELKAD